MEDIRWDTVEYFAHPGTGQNLIAWAEAKAGTTKVEFSMQDARIWKVLPRAEWLGVMLSSKNNAKMSQGSIWTTLFGFGRPNDPAGNLMLVRVHRDLSVLRANPKSEDAKLFAQATRVIMLTMNDLGIDMRSSMHDSQRNN